MREVGLSYVHNVVRRWYWFVEAIGSLKTPKYRTWLHHHQSDDWRLRSQRRSLHQCGGKGERQEAEEDAAAVTATRQPAATQRTLLILTRWASTGANKRPFEVHMPWRSILSRRTK
eukprot:5884353-Pleurochrysis_carterae.AAC.4